MSTSSKPMSVKIDDGFRQRLNDLATLRKRSTHAIAKEALEIYVGREEAKERFNQDALQAWNDYQETGLHVTEKAAMDWIASWGTPEELPVPVAHS
jgi:predicted transcriptional regulator